MDWPSSCPHGWRIFGAQDAKSSVSAFRAWLKKVGAPTTFAEISVPDSAAPAIAENADKRIKFCGIKDYPKSAIEEILKNAV
ncbi:MAG: hypothetical protein NTW04_00565 [Elusimicrobia bacterium]|nr:hypothetical protein [Elusimicrobiota bacterium]